MSSDKASTRSSELNFEFVASRLESTKKKIKLSSKSKLGQRLVCPHCDQSLCAKTFKKHKRLYCNKDNTWTRSSASTSVSVQGAEGKSHACLPYATYVRTCSATWQENILSSHKAPNHQLKYF